MKLLCEKCGDVPRTETWSGDNIIRCLCMKCGHAWQVTGNRKISEADAKLPRPAMFEDEDAG